MSHNGYRTLLVCVVLAVQIFGESVPASHVDHNQTINDATTVKSNATHTTAANDPKPVPLIADHPNHVHASHKLDNFTNLVRLDDVLTVFDLNELAVKWHRVHHEFHSECADDMTRYFRGLQHHKMWATKSK